MSVFGFKPNFTFQANILVASFGFGPHAGETRVADLSAKILARPDLTGSSWVKSPMIFSSVATDEPFC